LEGGTKLYILTFFKDIAGVESHLSTAQGKQEINTGNYFKDTPLHIAAERNYPEIIELLLENCANPCAENIVGQTPLDLAKQKGNMGIFKTLLIRYLNFIDLQGRTKLHILTFCNYIKEVQSLLETKQRKQDINEGNYFGNTPLHIAVEENHPDIVVLLLNQGASPRAKNKAGCTPLDLAEQKDNLGIFKTLLKYLRPIDLQGRTKLYILTFCNHIEKIQSLLKTDQGKQEINTGNYLGNTPLHIAAERNYPKIVELLLQNGANPCAKNKAGLTPLDLAKQKGNLGIFKTLLDAAPNSVKDHYKAQGNTFSRSYRRQICP
jgi:ankyrin repeat protein